MSKKNIYIFTILLLLILFGVISFLIYTRLSSNQAIVGGQKKEIVDNTNKDKTKEKVAIIQEKFSIDIAKENSDVKECLKIENKEYKNKCITSLAQYLQSVNICSNIQEQEMKEKCIDNVEYKKSITDGDFSKCSNIKLKELRRACIINIISEKNDVKESDCEILNSEEKDYCLKYFSFADDANLLNTAKSKNECNKIKNESLRIRCISKI